MKKAFLHSFIAAALLLGASIAANAQSISGSIANGTVTRGRAARATVYLDIPGGLHTNSSRPGNEYQIPTRVTPTARGVRIGAVSYPRGRDRKFGFSDSPINVYEGRTTFTFPITVPAGFKGSSIAVRVVVKYQACSNDVCYPPKNKEITLTARVN